MMKVSVVTANYVTRALGYAPPMPFNWGQCDTATQELFTGPRWESEWSAICAETAALGIHGIEVWQAHLPCSKVTEEHCRRFAAITADFGLTVSAYAGWFGGPEHDAASYKRACVAANIIGAPYFQGGVDWSKLDISGPIMLEHGIKVTIENHPGMETAEKMLETIALAPDVLAAGVDTGWFATVEADVAGSITLLKEHLLHVHFKDMQETGGHNSCAMGYGVVDMHAVMHALTDAGYSGYLSLEHEPAQGDPMAEVQQGLDWLKTHYGALLQL